MLKLLTLLALVGIPCYQILVQSNLTRWISWNLIALSSYVPYMSIYLLGIIQSIGLVFVVGNLFGKSGKIDTLATIDARSMSNTDYVIGKVWGVLSVFMKMALYALIIGMGINIFISEAPFHGGMYLFYWLVFLLPSLVFITGLSLFVRLLVRNRPISFMLLLGYFFISLFYWTQSSFGLYDFLGTSLPTTLSDFTGYPNLYGVLLHRLFWLFIGIGLIGFSVVLFQRLPNRPAVWKLRCGISTLFVVLAFGCGFFLFLKEYNYFSLRDAYRETYKKYSTHRKLTLEKQSLTYRQSGDRLMVQASLCLKNEHAEKLSPLILYLNPGLKIERLSAENRQIDFSQDNQVVVLNEILEGGATLNIEMEYSGTIDEALCYLELPDKDVNSSKTAVGSVLFRAGRRYAIVDKDYTLLTPECIWYPVSIPPINLTNPYAIEKNFAHYALKVVGEKERSILSQGERKESGDTMSFINEHGLPGISLCIGNYKRYGMTVDSVAYELYLLEGHDAFFDALSNVKDSMRSVIISHRDRLENENNRAYPYKRFMLVESPISFASYYRYEQGGSESVQPEMVFLPEKGVGFWSMNIKQTLRTNKEIGRQRNMTEDVERRTVDQLLKSIFSEYAGRTAAHPFFSSFHRISAGTSGKGLYNLSALFYDDVNYLYSPEFPIANMVVNHLLNDQGATTSSRENMEFRGGYYEEAMNYLKSRSIRDALEDPQVSPELLYQIVKLKSKILKDQYFGLNISITDFDAFIRQYLDDHKYKTVSFASFDKEFAEQFGLSWLSIFQEWYTLDRLPSFVIQDACIERIDDGQNSKDVMNARYRISASIYNDSDVDGIVVLSCDAIESQDGNFSLRQNMQQQLLIEAGKAKEVVMISEGSVNSATLNTVISENLPSFMPITPNENKTKKSDAGIWDIDTARFLPKAGELIVDDISKGFKKVEKENNRRLLQSFKSDTPSAYQDYDRVFLSNYKGWIPVIQSNFYGRHIRSGWMKKGGKGDSYVEWSVDVERAGYYEVFVHIPGRLRLQEYKRKTRRSQKLSSSMRKTDMQPASQYYQVQHDGEETEVAVEVGILQTKGGWLSLGEFYFSSGKASVLLTDKESKADQVIYADAVKWVLVE